MASMQRSSTRKIWLKDETKNVTVKTFVKTSEMSEVMPQNSIHSDKRHSKGIEGVPYSSSE